MTTNPKGASEYPHKYKQDKKFTCALIKEKLTQKVFFPVSFSFFPDAPDPAGEGPSGRDVVFFCK